VENVVKGFFCRRVSRVGSAISNGIQRVANEDVKIEARDV